MRLFDSHNHLQDLRLWGQAEELVQEAARLGTAAMVVNGTCEEDWPRVGELAERFPGFVLPSYGLHPWRVSTRSPGWQEILASRLDGGAAGVGEVGLDRWIEGYDLLAQREVLATQFALARERELPVTVHCLRAWGALLEFLDTCPPPGRGFLLHSFGGSVEVMRELGRRGAWFSFSGGFLQARKWEQKEVFRGAPLDRLLVETDAPDMRLPEERILCRVAGDPESNHPGNLQAVYQGLAEIRGMPLDELAGVVEDNFRRFFAGSVR